MLKLTVKRDDESRSFTTWSVDTPGGLLFWFRRAPGRGLPVWWVDTIGEPMHDPDCNCGAGGSVAAFSPLHALELGVAATARAIAVELLRDPTPSVEGEKVEGIALWLNDKPIPARLGAIRYLRGSLFAADYVGLVDTTRVPGKRDEVTIGGILGRNRDDEMNCASEEQALAALIEHAAPWIAVALAEELEKGDQQC